MPPSRAYNVAIVGGGGRGLAAAYYLAKPHGTTRVALIEKGWLGGGDTGRNTTVIRSNYFYPESVALYDLALRLYEGLSRDLNYNVMLSQRGILTVAHSEMEMEICACVVNAMQINGVDAELFGPQDVRKVAPLIDVSPRARFPVLGGYWQGRAGVARHDAVAWACTRAADALGVDILQNCEAQELLIEGGAGALGAIGEREPRRRPRSPCLSGRLRALHAVGLLLQDLHVAALAGFRAGHSRARGSWARRRAGEIARARRAAQRRLRHAGCRGRLRRPRRRGGRRRRRAGRLVGRRPAGSRGQPAVARRPDRRRGRAGLGGAAGGGGAKGGRPPAAQYDRLRPLRSPPRRACAARRDGEAGPYLACAGQDGRAGGGRDRAANRVRGVALHRLPVREGRPLAAACRFFAGRDA